MRPRIVVYVSAAELSHMRREAGRRRLSLSRYAKERLVPAPDQSDDGAHTLNGDGLPVTLEKRLGEQVREAFAARADDLAENLRTVMVMLDQMVRSTLTHLPEIPSAQHKERVAAGERRHRDWQGQVANLLRQMRSEAAKERPAVSDNGAHV
jgi:hypothetical protein